LRGIDFQSDLSRCSESKLLLWLGNLEGDEMWETSFFGEDAEDVLDITRISVEYRKNCAKVIEEFKMSKNIIFKCAWFDRQNQLANEPMEQFINEVHRLTSCCEIKMRDWLVVGILD